MENSRNSNSGGNLQQRHRIQILNHPRQQQQQARQRSPSPQEDAYLNLANPAKIRIRGTLDDDGDLEEPELTRQQHARPPLVWPTLPGGPPQTSRQPAPRFQTLQDDMVRDQSVYSDNSDDGQQFYDPQYQQRHPHQQAEASWVDDVMGADPSKDRIAREARIESSAITLKITLGDLDPLSDEAINKLDQKLQFRCSRLQMVSLMRKGLVGLAFCIEEGHRYFNQKKSHLLDGWAQEVLGQAHTYDTYLERIYDFYFCGMEMHPVVGLVIALGASAGWYAMCHGFILGGQQAFESPNFAPNVRKAFNEATECQPNQPASAPSNPMALIANLFAGNGSAPNNGLAQVLQMASQALGGQQSMAPNDVPPNGLYPTEFHTVPTLVAQPPHMTPTGPVFIPHPIYGQDDANGDDDDDDDAKIDVIQNELQTPTAPDVVPHIDEIMRQFRADEDQHHPHEQSSGDDMSESDGNLDDIFTQQQQQQQLLYRQPTETTPGTITVHVSPKSSKRGRKKRKATTPLLTLDNVATKR